MNVLGIETSCDETSVALVKSGRKVLSNVVASSLRFHKKYGGIIPEIASRLQLETISHVAAHALEEAGAGRKDVGLISVTSGPGLLGSLLVGISFAKSLSLSWGIPLIGVDHVNSHIYANFLDNQGVKLPFIALVVSGGHTSLFLVEDFDTIKLLGATQDDACGEAFDKVARILGLGFPGGPYIEQLAKSGDARRYRFGCSGTKDPLDFSFSGIKTAVLYAAGKRRLNLPEKKDLCASFQEAVIKALINKALLACELNKINRLVIGGGVAANKRLRERFLEDAGPRKVKCFFPAKELCMDNAAMVAGYGFQLFRKGLRSGMDLTAQLQ